MSNTFVPFVKRYSFEERLSESQKIAAKYRLSIPVIVEPKDNHTQRIDKTKFLVPHDLTYGQFVYVIRKRLKINASESIFLFSKGSLPKTSDSIQHIHKSLGDADGFLYFIYAFENTFG